MIPAATRYVVTTHATSSTLAEKLPCIWGRATLTIELSRTSRIVHRITEAATIHLRAASAACACCWAAAAGKLASISVHKSAEGANHPAESSREYHPNTCESR